MNADASRGVELDADIGATVPALDKIAIGLLVGGAVVLAVGALLIILPLRRAAR